MNRAAMLREVRMATFERVYGLWRRRRITQAAEHGGRRSYTWVKNPRQAAGDHRRPVPGGGIPGVPRMGPRQAGGLDVGRQAPHTEGGHCRPRCGGDELLHRECTVRVLADCLA